MNAKIDAKAFKQQFDYISFMTLDGEYLNQMNVFQVTKPLNLVFKDKKDFNDHTQEFKAVQVRMMKMVNFDASDYPQCLLDITYKRKFDENGKLVHGMIVRDARLAAEVRGFRSNCLGAGKVLTFNTHMIPEDSVNNYSSKLKLVVVAVVAIQLVLLYISVYEADRFHVILLQRIGDDEIAQFNAGENLVSYASQFSLFVQSIIFMTNFSIFIIFMQLAMIG